MANATIMTVATHQPASETLAFGRRWLADAQELDDPWSVCEALTLMAGASGDASEVEAAGTEALALAREIGAPSRVALMAPFLAAVIGDTDPERARRLLEEAARAAEKAGNDWIEFVVPAALARIQTFTGDRRQAAETILHSVEFWAGDKLGGLVVPLVGYLAGIFALIGDEEGALRLAAWSTDRGQVIDPSFFRDFGAAELLAARRRIPAEEQERLIREVSALNDLAIARYARHRLDHLDRLSTR